MSMQVFLSNRPCRNRDPVAVADAVTMGRREEDEVVFLPVGIVASVVPFVDGVVD